MVHCYTSTERGKIIDNSLKEKGILKPAVAWGQCCIQSFLFAEKYKTGVVKANSFTFPGREHWAIYNKKENMVIDLTARQFTTKVPARFETQLDFWLDEVCEWLGDSITYELYESFKTNNPFNFGDCVREEIDPYEFKREQAGLKQITKERKL